MQRKMKFALFGNTYQEHKSAHVTHLLEILRRKEAHICIHREFYEFLRLHTNADLTNLEIFNGHDFTADMALSVGGDGTFLKTASLVGNKEIPILGINTGRLGFLADISPDQMEETFDEIYQGMYLAEPRRVLKLTCNGQVLKGYPYGLNETRQFFHDYHSCLYQRGTVECVSGRRADCGHPYRLYRLLPQCRRSDFSTSERYHQPDSRSSTQFKRPPHCHSRRVGSHTGSRKPQS